MTSVPEALLTSAHRTELFDFLEERIGGAEEDRTPDLLTASQALSQLSYGPTRERSC